MRETDGEPDARTEGLRAVQNPFSYPSVGATEHAVLAAAGQRRHPDPGAAREPEMGILCRLLNAHGGQGWSGMTP